MSKKAYSDAERQAVRAQLLKAGRELFAAQGYRGTTLAQVYGRVGISRNFFYTFFPSKEDFVIRTLQSQRPLLLDRIRAQMGEGRLSWQDSFRAFMADCMNRQKSGIAILTIDEQEMIFRSLSPALFDEFHTTQVAFFQDLLAAWGLPDDERTAKILGNMALSLLFMHNSAAQSLPFLFLGEMEETAHVLVESIIRYLQRL